MIAGALLLAAAGQPAARFAPPLDRPLLVRTEQERAVAGVIRRFVAERRLVFRRAGGAIVAELTLIALSTDAEGPVAQRFLTGAAGLKGMPLRFQLSAAGAVEALEAEDAAWQAATAPFARLRPPRDPAAATRPGAALAEVPAARRLAVLAAPLLALIAADEAALAPGSAPVVVGTGAATLRGTRSVAADGGRLVLVTRGSDPAAGTTIERRRTVDPATGLLIAEDEEARLVLDGGEQVTRSSVRVTPG